MSSDIYDLLDELAARGRRLRGQLPGDYKPVGMGDPVSDSPGYAHSLIWPDGPAGDEGRQPKEAAA